MLLDSLTWGKITSSIITGATLSVLVGNPGPILFAMFILFAIDTITGIMGAIKLRKFQSHAMRKACVKFLIYCLSIIVAHQFAAIPLLGWIEDTVIAFLSLVELSSIGENIRKLGYSFPTFKQLTSFIKRHKDETV